MTPSNTASNNIRNEHLGRFNKSNSPLLAFIIWLAANRQIAFIV